MTDSTTASRSLRSGLYFALSICLAVDVFVFRTVLAGREAFLFRFSGRLLPALAFVYVFGLLAAVVHAVVVLRDPRVRAAPDSLARDSRRLVVGSFVVAVAYFAFHAWIGPLGGALRRGDAFTLYGSLRDACPTYGAAALHSSGLVAIGLHGYELARRIAPPHLRTRCATAAVAFAMLHGGAVLDPIALLTIGKTLVTRVDPSASVILPVDSATVGPR